MKQTSTNAKGVYRFLPGCNTPLKKGQPKISPESYAREFLFQENHPMSLSNCGMTDLINVREEVKSKGLFLDTEGTLFLSLVYIWNKCKNKDKNKLFITFEVHEYWKSKYTYDKTSYNHALNRLASLGVLSFKKVGQKNIQYFLSDSFVKNGGFDWFFSKSNLKPLGIFYNIPGSEGLWKETFIDILNKFIV